MFRTTLLALALLLPAGLPAAAAPGRSRAVLERDPLGDHRHERGGRGVQVLERFTGSEARADARAASWQARYPNW